MAENSQTITYEMLYEMLRAEKNSAKLQKLSPSFYQECNSYFNEKKSSLTKESTNRFAKKDFILIQKQIENVRNLLENLHSIRMKKIVLLAQDKTKIETILVDKTPMLEKEKELFDKVSKLLLTHKNTTLNLIFSEEEMAPIPEPVKKNDISKNVNDKTKSKDNSSSDISDDDSILDETDKFTNQDSKTKNQENNSSTIKEIKFTQSVAKFFDADMNAYGPYEKGNKTSLPDNIIKILLDKGAIEIIN